MQYTKEPLAHSGGHLMSDGNAPAHGLFDRLQVAPRNPGIAVRSFADYAVTFDGQAVGIGDSVAPVGPGVQLTRLT
jgi:hypothetical protein